jgi:hypothetical protein
MDSAKRLFLLRRDILFVYVKPGSIVTDKKAPETSKGLPFWGLSRSPGIIQA